MYNNQHSHGSMSVPEQGGEHGTWSGHDSLPVRAVSPEQNERQMPVFGPYVGVIHASDEQDHGQADVTALSDVEEIMAAKDEQADAMGGIKRSTSDESLNASWDISSGTSSGSSSVEDLQSTALPAGSGSYVHLPYPTAPRYASDQNDTSYYRRIGDSAADVKPPVGIEYVQENPAYPQKQKKPRKDRSRFDRDALDETNKTRLLKACVTCRKQKIRCRANKDDPSAPCDKCRSAIISKSGKITHRTLCVRTETVSSIVIVRPGLGFTSRTEGNKMFNIPPEDWADDTIKTIKMLQGLSQRPIVVKVRKFKPRDGDVTERFWDDNGTPRPVPLEPYCLADIHQTADYFAKYLFETALYGLRDAAESSSGRLVRETYGMIVRHGEKLIARSKWEPDNKQVTGESDFFFAVLKLVWSIRHMTGSVWLDGEEQLSMTAPKDPTYPLKNKTGENAVMLPRMIVAQFDCLQNQKILPDQLKKVLMQLETRLSAAKEEWFSMYLAIFMLLHEIAVASKDRYRWAREHKQGPRYGAGKYAALGKYVENFQRASVPLLAYWSYYRVDNLGEVDWNDLSKTNKIKTLESEQIDFLRESVRMLRKEAKDIPKTPNDGCWEHELFFVNRMFMHDWLHNFRTFQFMDE
ncbi:hypothetical protein GE09DRAFT_1215780 [Coniochaeta sp. 2T2.1]|nr:hypothetical protein GE09DRAFT_1215780 [Coniochaeta sp. 2T2.1]